MKRALGLTYGVLSYLFFVFVFLRAIWFVWTMDRQLPRAPLATALLINAALLGAFAVQHSGMARQRFKDSWTRIIPRPLERSTYVLFASLALLTVVQFWQPVAGTIWSVQNRALIVLLDALFWFGWTLLFASTFLIDHFDLFGVKQSWQYYRQQEHEPPKFRTPGPYRLVRHPLYLGFLIAFWSAPHMTSGRIFFATMCTAYILIAVQFEERDLLTLYGDAYQRYRRGVSMLLPIPRLPGASADE